MSKKDKKKIDNNITTNAVKDVTAAESGSPVSRFPDRKTIRKQEAKMRDWRHNNRIYMAPAPGSGRRTTYYAGMLDEVVTKFLKNIPQYRFGALLVLKPTFYFENKAQYFIDTYGWELYCKLKTVVLYEFFKICAEQNMGKLYVAKLAFDAYGLGCHNIISKCLDIPLSELMPIRDKVANDRIMASLPGLGLEILNLIKDRPFDDSYIPNPLMFHDNNDVPSADRFHCRPKSAPWIKSLPMIIFKQPKRTPEEKQNIKLVSSRAFESDESWTNIDNFLFDGYDEYEKQLAKIQAESDGSLLSLIEPRFPPYKEDIVVKPKSRKKSKQASNKDFKNDKKKR